MFMKYIITSVKSETKKRIKLHQVLQHEIVIF